MTDVTNTEEIIAADAEQQTTGAETDISTPDETVASAEEKLAQLTKELDDARETLAKARKGEKYAKAKASTALDAARAEARAELESELNDLRSKVESFTQREFEQSLGAALAEAGAIDQKALTKLIGRTDNVAEAVKTAQTEYPNLFKQVAVPKVQKSAEGVPTNGFAQELQAAASTGNRAAMDAVYAKWGMTARG